MNWTALYAILKNSINSTKAELEQEITEKIGLTNQFLDELPETGESGVLYFIPKDDADPSAEDQYFMYVWDPDNSEFVFLDPDVDLSPYAKSADLATVATTGAYSDLSGTPDLTPYITETEADERYMSGDVLDDETVTGNPITFESLDGGHAKSCEVSFSPKQDLHGYDSPWPGGGGKNKFPLTVETLKSANTTGTWSGNVYSNQGLTYTIQTDLNNNVTGILIKGTTTGNTSFYIIKSTDAVSFDTEMILSGCPSGGSYSTYGFRGTDSSLVEYGSGVNVPANTGVYGRIYIAENYTLPTDGLLYQPMLRLATDSDPTFAPYSNICPISGWDSLSLRNGGKNRVIYVIENSFIDANGVILYSGDYDMLIAPVTQGVEYTVTTSSSQPRFGYYTNAPKLNSVSYNATRTMADGSVFTVTAPITGYIAVRCNHGFSNWQIEEGETATERQAPTDYTATFPSTVYSGTWKVTEGKAIIDRISVNMADIAWTYSSQQGYFGIGKSVIGAKTGTASAIMCSCYKYMASAVTGKTIYQTNSSIRIIDTDYTDADTFIASLNGQTMVVYLKTPTEITLTAEQIELLKGMNVLWTDGDDIKLTAAQLELVKVVANPSGQATGTLSKIQINNDILAIPSELPAVTSLDEGKVLMVNDQGEWVADDIPDGTNTQY